MTIIILRIVMYVNSNALYSCRTLLLVIIGVKLRKQEVRLSTFITCNRDKCSRR